MNSVGAINNNRKSRLIYLVEENSTAIQGFIVPETNYRFEILSDLSDLVKSCKNQQPDAVIYNFASPVLSPDVVETFSIITNPGRILPIIIFISENEEIAIRLQAVQLGAYLYFSRDLRDFNYDTVLTEVYIGIDKVYRALFISEVEHSFDSCCKLFSDLSVQLTHLAQPLDSLKVLEEKSTDIIILDSELKSCAANDLAQILRSEKSCSHLPLVFYHPHSGLIYENCSAKGENISSLWKSAVLDRIKQSNFLWQENNQLQNALRESSFQLSAMDQHGLVSISAKDGSIISLNERFCELSGYSYDELIGKNYNILKSGYHPLSFFKEMWECISNGQVWHGIICNRKKNGEDFWLDTTIVPVFDENGVPSRFVSAQTDITALRQSEERLHRSQQFANIGTWDWNLKTDELYWSERVGPLLGYNGKISDTNYEKFLLAIHPDDRQMVVDSVNNCVENGIDYDIEHRVIWPDNSLHWLHESGNVIRDEEGNPLHMLGLIHDVTKRVNLEKQLQQQRQMLDMLHRATTDFVSKGDFYESMNVILDSLLEFTESEYGCIGEVLYDDIGKAYLETHTVRNIAWKQESQALYKKFKEKEFDFECLESLFDDILENGQSVVYNKVDQNVLQVQLENHSPLPAVLGVPLYYGDELVGMYAIANRLQGYEAEIQELLRPFNTTCGVIIHSKRMMDREHQNLEKLVSTKNEAEKANRAKSQFLSSMSHELRTPMNAIMGFSQLLKIDTKWPLSDTQKKNVDEILKASKHLLELINEVLELSKIESGRIQLTIESVQLASIVTDSLHLIAPLAKKRGIKVNIIIADELIEIESLSRYTYRLKADQTRVKQALINLLSNAVKYNCENGSITISFIETVEGYVRINVKDTGKGISPEQQPQLFKAFNRLGAERSSIEGTGIGLVITKKIIELMGGRVGFSSQPNQGSTFWFELPNDTSRQKIHEAKDINFKSNQTAHHQREQKTVLYIEDNPANLRLVSQLIGRENRLHMWSAHEPLLGLELAVENQPDLILLDVNLPGMSGYDVLEQLRCQKQTIDIPVIAISGNSMKWDIQKGLKAGFNSYITKPIDVELLMDAIHKALGDM